jgi:N-acetylglucosamine transport system substrate-binding protein
MPAMTRRLFLSSAATALAGCDAIHRVSPLADAVRKIEVAAFEGGYGIEWHQRIGRQYNALMAGKGVVTDVWGDQRVEEKIKPRILRGDAPNLILANRFPIWLMIGAGEMHAWDTALDKPGWGVEKTQTKWRDQFQPGMLDIYSTGKSVYAIPTSYGGWGCWYDAKMFREHGWTPPKTWSEFSALCDEIKKAGIAPLAYQGKYPYYAWYTIFSVIQRCGGLAAINRINACEANAFSHPDVLHAAKLMQDMARDHLQKGALAMTHTESQNEFVQGRAAMIFCGVWLENEMKATTPKNFEMRCFTVPAVEGGKGNPHLFNGQGMEFMFAPGGAPNFDDAAAFTAYMMSLENGPDMARSIGVISPIKGGVPREVLSPALQSIMDIAEASPGSFSDRVSTLLLEWFGETMQPSLTALLAGTFTPEQFGRAMDAGIESQRANPDIIFPPYNPYDGRKFGEPA